MRTFNLIEGNAHIILTCVQTGNNFGDQILDFYLERLDGSIERFQSSHQEGSWIKMDTETLLKEFEYVSGMSREQAEREGREYVSK